MTVIHNNILKTPQLLSKLYTLTRNTNVKKVCLTKITLRSSKKCTGKEVHHEKFKEIAAGLAAAEVSIISLFCEFSKKSQVDKLFEVR